MENNTAAKDTLDLLLHMEPPKAETSQVKIKRLSKAAGGDVVFELRGLGYSRVAELRAMHEEQEVAVQAVLAGVTSPDLKNPALLEKYRAVTPAELVKAMLTPGEVEDLYRRIQRLSGYLSDTLEELKKNRYRPRAAGDVLHAARASPAAGGLLAAARGRQGGAACVLFEGHGAAAGVGKRKQPPRWGL